MRDRSGLSRGDRNRNARLARLREAVPFSNAIAGIDLADSKQMVVVTDHESRVLARRNIDAVFAAAKDGDFDAIVTNAAGCGSAMKGYARLLAAVLPGTNGDRAADSLEHPSGCQQVEVWRQAAHQGGQCEPDHAADEQEHLEAFLTEKIREGAALPGTYPPNEATRAAFEEWKKLRKT